jgi:hypothetical protein
MSFFPRLTLIKASKPAEESVPPPGPEPGTAGHQIVPVSASVRPQPRSAGPVKQWLTIRTAFPRQPPESPGPVRRWPQLIPPWSLPGQFRQPPWRWGGGSQGNEESGGRAAGESGERAGGSRGR